MPRSVRPIRRQLLLLAVIPLVALLGLWGFATYLTVGDGYRLYNQGRLITQLAAPAEEILGAIQGERRASAVFVATGSIDSRVDLTRARALVDAKIDAYRGVLKRDDVRSITPDHVMELAQTQLKVLDKLAPLRQQVDGRGVDNRVMMDSFTDLVDPITPLYSAVATFPDDRVSAEGQALQRLAHARELRARVDAVLAGALATGRFTRDTYIQFVAAVGVMRAEYHETYVKMTGQYRREVDDFFAKEPYVSLARMEDAALATNGQGAIPVNPGQWREANTTALAQLSDFQLHLATFVEDHAKGPAYLIFGRILIAGLFGLVGVIVTVVVSLRIARRLANRLRDLSASAHTLSDVQLPNVVDRLRRGEQVDVDAEAPMLGHSGDEIGQVNEAFNTVRRTAIRTAVEQAELRAGIRNVFINIARRSQTLVKKQLTMLDTMERKTVDPEELADLFRVDHLATRMQRYAESLVILGGGRPGRSWGRPVPMQEVLRGAASEAEQYERVRVSPMPPVVLAGSVVSDVIHLVAELVDNATTFSPPHTLVQISGQQVPHGFAIEVVDRGLGMNAEDMAAANAWLANPPEFNVLALSDSPRLGMFVVARIAARHEIRVSLRDSPYGGVTAIVLVPPHLVADVRNAQDLSRRDAALTGADRLDGEDRTLGAERPVLAGVVAEPLPALGDRESTTVRLRSVPGWRPAGATAIAAPVTGTIISATTGAAAASTGTVEPPVGDGAEAAEAARAAETTEATEATETTETTETTDTAEPADSRATRTHRGLPVRVRQARLAPGLRDAPPEPPATPAPSRPARSPEDVRRMMSAYQRGTARGRCPGTGDDDRSSTLDTVGSVSAERPDEER
ncbi:nitrate- and nitrite sensing domain-containing protein [Planosporangium sp. 12N6]|uniref:nitrate- and nitrite sensing domain-containing protein n=1 Tax=Planosporangium spinosum TaxID=3402278 RepID=UPI003CF742D3